MMIHFKQQRKGQYLILQEVLGFGMGLIMLIGVLGTFTYMKDSIQDSVRESQIEVVANSIATAIEEVQRQDAPSEIRIPIPEQLGEKQFRITTNLIGSQHSVSVTAEGQRDEENVTASLRDTIVIGYKNILISKIGSQIEIRGV